MKKSLFLLTAVLSFGMVACTTTPAPVPAPTPAHVSILNTAALTFAVGEVSTVVSVKAGQVGSEFCFTDSTLKGALVCNNLPTGSRAVRTGTAYQAKFYATENGKRVPAQ